MNNSIVDSSVAAIAGAAAKHGSDLIADATPADADETLRLVRHLVARIRASAGSDAEVAAATAGVAEQSDAADRIEVLRRAVMDAASRDDALTSDLAIMLSSFSL
jgi:hypothetical protein